MARLHVERWGAGGTHTEDEEQLNEHGTEGQDPSHEDAATEKNVNSAQTPAIGKPVPLLSISTENAYTVAVLGLCNVVTPLFLFEKTVCVCGEIFQFIDGNSEWWVTCPRFRCSSFFIFLIQLFHMAFWFWDIGD